MRLRVLTYNIHKGFCYYSREYVLDRLREQIRSVGADLVFLQEVMGVHPKGSFEIESQFEYLADSLWAHYAYGKNAVYDSGHHGNAILSKFPILSHSNTDVSTNPFEQRGVLHVDLQIHGVPMHLFCLHFDLLEKGRTQQIELLKQVIIARTQDHQPTIIAGDFNDWRQRLGEQLMGNLNFSEVGLATKGSHHKSFPAWMPFWAMDRIYVRGFRVLESHVLKEKSWKQLSDHLPIVADLELI